MIRIASIRYGGKDKMNSFLDLAENGKNQWWRYLLSFAVIFIFWMVIGSIPAVITVANKVSSIELNFIGLMASFVFLILGLWISIRSIHKRKFITLITARKRVSWRLYFYGFSFAMVILLIVTGVDFLWHPEGYHFSLSQWTMGQFVGMFLLCVVFIPIQTAAEEMLFRGYILQGIGRKIKSPYVLSIITAILFTLPHLGNPEVASKGLAMSFIYFSIGMLLAHVTLKSNGLELAMGVHCANNLFGSVIVNMSDSALITRPLFFLDKWHLGNALIGQILFLALFYCVLKYGERKGKI